MAALELAGNSFLSCVLHHYAHTHHCQLPISHVPSVLPKPDRELPGDRQDPQCAALHLVLCACSPDTTRALHQVAETQGPIQHVYVLP